MPRISIKYGDAEWKFTGRLWQDSVMYTDPQQSKRPNEAGLSPLIAVAHLGMRGMHGVSEAGSQAKPTFNHSTCG